jgi:hypothetical protein
MIWRDQLLRVEELVDRDSGSLRKTRPFGQIPQRTAIAYIEQYVRAAAMSRGLHQRAE